MTVISFPDSTILDELSPLPNGITPVIWDLQSDPVACSRDQIEGVILPYMGAGGLLGELTDLHALKFVQTQSTGYDGVIEAVGPDVAVANAAGVHAAATSELAVGLILAKLRGIDVAVRDQTSHTWNHVRRQSLADRKVLLLGVGGIGMEIAKRLEPFEVTLTRVGSRAREDDYGVVHGVESLSELAAQHDVLVTVLPLSESTHHLISTEVLAAMPDGALLVNVGRGAVVDTAALTAEIVAGRLHCALDVMDPEPLPADSQLWDSPNAIITPHLGGDTSAFAPRILRLLSRQLSHLAEGKSPENLVQRGKFS